MDKRTVESLCSIRGTPEIVNILTREIDENDVGQGTKSSLNEMLQVSVSCLVWLRDQGKMKMSFQTIKDSTTFEGMIKLSHNKDVPVDMRKLIQNYLGELPGFNYGAVDENGAAIEGKSFPRLNLEGAKKQHDFLRSLFMNPATKAGL